MPGPAPTPTAILKARGSRRVEGRKHEPKAWIGVPMCPKHLNTEARAEWRRVVKVIAPGVLTKDSGETLARYCHGVTRWRKLAKWLDDNDDTVTTDNGMVRVHPKVRLYAELGDMLLRYEQQIGLTPAARARVQVAPAPNGELNEREKSKADYFKGPRLATA